MLRRKYCVSTLLILSVFLSGCTLSFGKKSGIQITANPQSEVSIDGKSLGKTPSVEQGLKPGVLTVRITPIESGLEAWEGKVELKAGYLTIVDRQFGRTQDSSSGYTLVSEKLPNDNSTEVTIISTPSNIPVKIDGSPVGFSNHPIQAVAPGDHSFSLEAPGYSEKTIRAKLLKGTRLVVTVQMAVEAIAPTPTPTPLVSPSVAPTPTSTTQNPITPLPRQSTSSASLAKPYVEILNTPTGWLKVREKPSVSSSEMAKVNPGDTFTYKEASISGWFQIEYRPDLWGFVSSQYSKLVK